MSKSLDFQDDHREMDELIRRTVELHSAPLVARSILNLTRDLDYDVREVVQCLEADPALSAKILRIVNSSQYGLSRQITNLRQAVAYLGQRSLRLVSLTFSLVDGLTRGPAAELYAAYWRRSLTMATVASKLSESSAAVQRNDAYAAGLLADIGVLLLAQRHGGRYVALAQSTPHGLELVEAERQQFGFGHPALGARLLQRWDFPTSLVEAAAHHHEDRTHSLPLGAAVRAADLVADVLWNPQSREVTNARTLLEEHFGLDVNAFIELARWCKSEVQQNAEIFGIDLRASIDCDKLAEEARRRVEETGGQVVPQPDCPVTAPLAPEQTVERTTTDLHIGRAFTRVYRDSDVMRQGIEAEFLALSSFAIQVRLPFPLVLHEPVQLRFTNDAQRFAFEVRGLVQWVSGPYDGRYHVRVELCTALRPSDIAALRRAGVFDHPIRPKMWV